jgi:hypothetical protein
VTRQVTVIRVTTRKKSVDAGEEFPGGVSKQCSARRLVKVRPRLNSFHLSANISMGACRSTDCPSALGETMEIFVLGVALGFIAGYTVRALISHMHRRRFEEEYGFNPRLRSK